MNQLPYKGERSLGSTEVGEVTVGTLNTCNACERWTKLNLLGRTQNLSQEQQKCATDSEREVTSAVWCHDS